MFRISCALFTQGVLHLWGVSGEDSKYIETRVKQMILPLSLQLQIAICDSRRSEVKAEH